MKRSRFQLNSLMLIALLAGLAFVLLGSPAQAGWLANRRAARAAARGGGCGQYATTYSHQTYSTYAAAPAPCGPCGQTAGYVQTYSYAAAPAAPCAPCGSAAPAYSAPAPVYYPSTAPPVYSAPPPAPAVPVPQVGARWDCSKGACRLIR